MRRFFLSLLVLCWTLPASAELFQLDSFTLDNGLQVIIIPNHRAPVVMQIVYYRTGQADEAPGKSGLAHFLEHLIFKGTSNAAPGEFSAMVARMGGEENAFTTRDTTAYWQMVDRDRLEVILRYEADRMQNLLLKDDEVLPERDVILEERRQRIDNDARQRLNERVQSALFVNHPYRIPTIGWMHEMAALTPDDARAWYQRWYAPNNAILLLGGDITLEEARPLIEKYYGVIPRKDLPLRWRPLEPPAWAARRVELSDATVQQEQLSQVFRLPHRSELQVGDAEALDVLAEIMGGGGSSRLYRSLAIEQALASRAGAFAQVDMIDYGSFSLYAIPRDGVTLDALEAALNAERQRLLAEGVSATEVADAIRRLTDSAVFARDDPTTAPRLIGSLLAAGWTLEEIQSWPERVAAVTPERVNELARLVLIPENSVTGLLRKGQP